MKRAVCTCVSLKTTDTNILDPLKIYPFKRGLQQIFSQPLHAFAQKEILTESWLWPVLPCISFFFKIQSL